MGKAFGNLRTIRGITYFTLSPFHQRAFAGVINPGIKNVFRRTREDIFYVLPPMILGYLIYDSTIKLNDKMDRKNPKDFENDV